VLKKLNSLPTTTAAKQQYLKFSGSNNFRERILCSTLSSKPIRIDEIRSLEENPGLSDYEASLLRLVEKISNGCEIKINETGTSIKYKPGLLIGGAIGGITHNCPTSRGIGYYIEFLLRLAPFCKNSLQCSLSGITNNNLDLSVDLLRTATLPIFKQFGLSDPIEIKIKKRGAEPEGGGEVYFSCPIVRQLNPIHWIEEGLVKRVRGIAYTTRCNPQLASRMVDSVRGVFNNLLPDVYIYTDHYKGKDSGNSPGYAITLVAESTSGVLLSSELSNFEAKLPEEVGSIAANLLLQEIESGGVIDSAHQSLVLLLMVLCSEDVSKVRLGKLSAHTIDCLRLYKDFFGAVFKLNEQQQNKTVIASVVGSGYKNWTRKAA
jgi:RNA 3'-terminal phosphate cyclase-like protein